MATLKRMLSNQHFLGALVLVVGAPFLAPAFAALGNKAFSADDWTLFVTMMLFSLAASTKWWLAGVLNLISAAIMAAAYAGQTDNQAFPLWGSIGMAAILVAFILVQVFERHTTHIEGGEKFW